MSKQLGSKVLMLRPDPIKTRGLLEKKGTCKRYGLWCTSSILRMSYRQWGSFYIDTPKMHIVTGWHQKGSLFSTSESVRVQTQHLDCSPQRSGCILDSCWMTHAVRCVSEQGPLTCSLYKHLGCVFFLCFFNSVPDFQ